MKKLSWVQVVIWLRACHLLCNGSTMHYALCIASCYALTARSWYLASWPSSGRAHQPTMSFLPSLYLAVGPCVCLAFCFVPASIHLLAMFYLRCWSSFCLRSVWQGHFLGAWHQLQVEVWCETNSMYSFGLSFLLLLLFNPCLQDDQVSPCSKAKQHWALLKIQILLAGCVLLLSRACPLSQVGSRYMYNSSRILQYCKIEHFIKRHSTKEQSQWKYFRLEIEYVARLEQLATKLEQEAKIIRGFLAKNYGHFDSRWSCLAPWAIILIFLETCFSFLLILVPIADCNQSQQI